ncbi:MAG: carbamoyltransferase [Deltaproteobacteria bacterium]|nr:carbamoyltransferase [Deltaproteobacteria bacterium]
MNILGISCWYHDSAAALVQDGRVVGAASEERFTRKKHDEEFPQNAVEYVLRTGGVSVKDLDAVIFYDKPFVKFERLLTTYLGSFPWSLPSFAKAMPVWIAKKLWIKSLIRKELDYNGELLFMEHHQSHAASAFLTSPFEKAAILCADGVGEWATTTFGEGEGNRFRIIREVRFPHSLGLLYSAFTYYLGFKVNSAEYKVMGLAPYGEPKYVDLIMDNLLDLRDDGSFQMNMDYFSYHKGLRMTNGKFDRLFGRPPRQREEDPLEQFHKDMAMSVQKVTEEAILRMARHLHRETGKEDLCMAGGVALNCVANGRLLREGPFRRIYVQPAAGDAGGALGAALFGWYTLLNKPRTPETFYPYTGPEYSDEEIQKHFDEKQAPYRKLSRDELVRETARLLDEEQAVIGWMQGKMEFGPRALGNRSILADPRRPDNRDRVNLKVKFRESFRPFAPIVLEEKAEEWFDLRGHKSPYMLHVCQVHPQKRTIPAVTHVDGSARIQTVSREMNPLVYDVLAEFDRRTGCPLLINTSYNVRSEPIVNSPEDAYRCFMATNIDYLVVGPYLLDKREQPEKNRVGKDWLETFELD